MAVATGPGDGDGLTSWSPYTPLAQAWREIYSNRMAMAYFMCEKVANTRYTNADAIAPWGRLYEDVHLLYAVTGIRFSSDYMVEAARFAKEWRAGIYKNPGEEVKQLCEERLSKENIPLVRAGDFDLTAICHYGIFGAPELIRQIKQHNSKHAFAAYLLVTAGRREASDYSDYLYRNDEVFITAEDKIAYIKNRFEEMKKEREGVDSDVMGKISAALDDSVPITAPKPKTIVIDSSTEFLKTITDTNTGQYAVVNQARDTVTLKDGSNKIIWSTNVIKGIEEIGDEHWDPIREMRVSRNGDTLFLLLTEGHGKSASINISTGDLRYSNRKTILQESGTTIIDPATGQYTVVYSNAVSKKGQR